MTIWRMRIACKAINKHSEYVIIIVFQCNNGNTKFPHVTLYVHCQSRFLIKTARKTKQHISLQSLVGKEYCIILTWANIERQSSALLSPHVQSPKAGHMLQH